MKLWKKLVWETKEKEFLENYPEEKKQRVAVARAISKKPRILFADEPCANLDTKTSEQVLEVFKMLNQKYGQTIVMVTHEPWHLKYVSRIINLKDGLIVSDRKVR